MELAVQVVVDERQLYRVADLLDLRTQTADVGVLDRRDLLEEELVDLRLGHHLVGHAGLGIDQDRVAGADGCGVLGRARTAQGGGEDDDVLLVVAHDHSRADTVGEHVPQDGGHTGDRELARDLQDRHGLVEAHGHARGQVRGVHAGGDRQAHAATGGHDLDGVRAGGTGEDHAVGAGRGAEPLDLALEGLELVA